MINFLLYFIEGVDFIANTHFLAFFLNSVVYLLSPLDPLS